MDRLKGKTAIISGGATGMVRPRRGCLQRKARRWA